MKTAFAFFAACAFICLVGCISVNYVGETFPETASVKVYSEKTKIKRPYSIMGQACASAPYQQFSREEIQKKLIDKAEAVGASAILITAYEIIPDGDAREDQLMNNSPSNAWAIDDDSSSSWTHMNQNFNYGYGTVNAQQMSTDVKTYKRVLQAKFLKFKK